MSLTRANVEREVCNLIGRIMRLAGLHGGTFDGTNADLNGPMRDALTRMGYSIADPAGLTVGDADFAALNTKALRRLMEWTELFTLEQVDRDWWRVEQARPAGMEATVLNGLTRDPLASLKSRIVARLAELRLIVKTPYQSMNVPIAVGQIRAGTGRDPTVPPSMSELIPPWDLLPDGLWIYGRHASAFWGWDDWGWEGGF